MLYAYGLRLIKDDEHVRDIIHDLFIKLYTKPGIVKDSGTIKAYLLMSLRNACVNHGIYSSKHVDISGMDSFHIQFRMEDDSLEDKEEREVAERKVKDILDGLTPRQREIIYLRFLHQMEYEDISRVMNLSGQAARNLISRTIGYIRKRQGGVKLIVIF